MSLLQGGDAQSVLSHWWTAVAYVVAYVARAAQVYVAQLMGWSYRQLELREYGMWWCKEACGSPVDEMLRTMKTF